LSAPAPAARPSTWSTDALLVGMATIWAVNYSVVKYGAQQLQPLAYNATRIALAGAVLLALALRPGAAPPPWSERRSLMRLGLLGHGVYQALFVLGLNLTRAGNAALVAAANPALTALVAALLGVEQLRARTALGIGLAFLGVGTLITGSARGGAPSGSALGDGIVLLASLSWAFYSVLVKKHADHVPGLQITTWSLVGGFPLVLALGLPSLPAVEWRAVTGTTWAAVAYGGVAAMVIAMLMWSRGLHRVGPTRTALFGQLQPVIAVLFAWAALGEVPTAWQIAGAGLVLGGLVLGRRG
jgi:drug/metabolite transporter (DMT)-like permease